MDKFQLSVNKPYGSSDDAKKVIAQELAQVRKSQGLPKISAERNAAIQTATSKIEGTLDMGHLPRVHGAMADKMQSARRGAALATALGSAGLEKHLAKEEMEKKKRSARLKQLGRHSSQHTANSKSRGEPIAPRSSRNESTAKQAGNLSSSPSRRFPTASNPMSRAQSTRVPFSSVSSKHFLSTSRNSSGKRYIGATFIDVRDIHGIRDDSRVGKLLGDFGQKNDWVSCTVLKHQMATILQANIRGWLLRLRWWADPEMVVEQLHAKLKADAIEAERRAKLRRTLEVRSLNSKQKKTITNVMSKLFGAKSLQHGTSLHSNPSTVKLAAGRWGKLQKNADILVSDGKGERAEHDKVIEQGRDPEGLTELLGSDADSEFSDLEMEDITAVKMRAKTPPWQRQEESQWVGQYNKLTKSKAHSSLEMRWDLDACVDRLEACKARWRERNQTQEQQDAEKAAYDIVTQPLPPEVINNLLYPKYIERMIRLGLMDREDVVEEMTEESDTPRSATVLLPPPAAQQQQSAAPGLAPAPAPGPAPAAPPPEPAAAQP